MPNCSRCTCRHCRACSSCARRPCPGNGCNPETTGQLFGAPAATAPVLRCCCDVCGCRLVDGRRRCPFWPAFARPRWLTCAATYAAPLPNGTAMETGRSNRCG